jgi:hypothetical protein
MAHAVAEAGAEKGIGTKRWKVLVSGRTMTKMRKYNLKKAKVRKKGIVSVLRV